MRVRIVVDRLLKGFFITSLFFCFLFLFCNVLHAQALRSSENDLLKIHFLKVDSATMLWDGKLVKAKNNLYYATLPYSSIDSMVNMELISSAGSTVLINGIDANTVQGKLDDEEVSISSAIVRIDDNLELTIISEAGVSNSFDLLLKKGIWEVDSLVYSFKERYNIPGVSLALVNLHNTDAVYQSGFGYAIKESKTRVQPNHLFRLASMSKQHTAICILKLVEEGRLDVDGFVFGPNGVLKDAFPNVPARARRITIRHLLEHTSGYNRRPDYMFDRAYYGWSMERRIKAMLRSRQPNEPGEVFAYYNTGYGILGYIVEVVTGQSFEEYLKELYGTLGIEGIQVGPPQAKRKWNEVAYYSQNGSSSEGVDMEIRAPAGGLIASTDDLIKLLRVLDGNPLIPDLFSCEVRDMMFSPSEVGESRYALGWRTNHRLFPYSFYHGGSLAGVATLWVYSHNYAVILLCNSRSLYRNFDEDLYKTARDIIELAERLDL